VTVKRMKSAEVRQQWRDVLDHVRAGGTVVIEHYNKTVARIVPIEENAMPRYTITQVSRAYWEVSDTYVPGAEWLDRSEEIAQARRALLEKGGDDRHQPHCPVCGDMTPADADGNVMDHGDVPIDEDRPDVPDTHDQRCTGSGRPASYPLY
jgi:antitoxin (DNA-binding transcriptional repressor) of toxin-antitoxin stability system